MNCYWDQEIYFDEVADVLCVALAELTILLPITEVAEALLRTLHGPSFICRIVANMPDTFNEGNIFSKCGLNYILEIVCFKFVRV